MTRGPSVLVVDDSAPSLKAIGSALSDVDAALTLAGSGEEALRKAMDCQELAVAVLDVTMPGMGGFEVAELLRQRPRFVSVPIIFMTGVAMDQHHVFRGYELGAVDYIFKPVDPHTLRSKVSVFVELKRQREELERLNEKLERRVEIGAEGLRAAEQRFRAFMDSAYDTCMLCDADLRVIYINPAGLSRLAKPATLRDVVGKELNEIAPDIESRERLLSYIEVLATGRLKVIRELTTRPDDRGVVMEVRVFKVGDGLGVIATDITEREHAEREKAELAAQLHQAQKMEAVGTLASGVAHDFNNLLMGIGGCTNIALAKLAHDNPASIYLREIKKAVESGAAISRQLLTFSRRKDVKRRVLELNGIITGAQKMLERLLGEDIELAVRLGAEDSRVRADAGQMEQVVMNLAVNARDAMPKGGRLEIETKNARLPGANAHSLPRGDYVILTVTDTGTGMTEEVQRRVFEPFFTTKEVGKGTGLGLSTVHGIVGESKGGITVSSQLGHGTTFEIALKRSSDALDSEPPPPASIRPGQGTILLVEDERTVRMAARFYLEQGGYRVLEAEHGAQAIRRLHEHPGNVDLLLTDVVLRGMGGAEIAREVRVLRPDIRVLYMSAHARELLANQGRLGGDVSIIEKPFGPEVLLLRVQEVLDDAPERDATATRTLKRTILVVEDDSSARLAICGYLESCGWNVLAAEDGRHAVEVCQAHDGGIAVLLTDYSLPKMKGDAVAREVSHRHPEILIVYMSGYPDLELDPPGQVLTKPLDLEEVREAVERGGAAS